MYPTSGQSISRRTILGAMGLGAFGLAACQVDDRRPSGNDGSGTDAIEIPDFDVPDDDVNFRWVDSGDLKAVFIDAVLEAFGEKYPSVSTTYDGSGWANVSQVVPLGIRNGSAHDIFALPPEIPSQVAVNEGYVQPLEEIVPDFDTWHSAFPDTAFIPGIHVFNDRVYTWSLTSVRRLSRMLFFSTELMADAGYDDPARDITTWDEMRNAARAVTQTGTPGLTADGDTLDNLVLSLAQSAGWQVPISGLDPFTGEYSFDAPEVLEAVEFIQAMIDDGSVLPGFLTLEEADARAQMPSGSAGMILNGPWDIPAWKEQSPDWEYGITGLPTPDGRDFVVPYEDTGANMSWVYADSQYAEIAGQIISYMGSLEGQTAMVMLTEGNLQSVIPEANEAADQHGLLDDKASLAAELADDMMRLAPQIQMRNEAAGAVQQALQPVQPALREILQGVFTGQIDDVRQALADYTSEMNSALDEAISSATSDGASISRDDYVFGNWEPSADYTAEDYEDLP